MEWAKILGWGELNCKIRMTIMMKEVFILPKIFWKIAFLSFVPVLFCLPLAAGPNEDLRAAVAANNAKEVSRLIDLGGAANQKIGGGKTLLMIAAQEGFDEVVSTLIKGAAQINEQDAVGQTALMYAAAHGHRDTVKVLILARADLTLKSMGGATALNLAEKSGFEECAVLLKKAAQKRP